MANPEFNTNVTVLIDIDGTTSDTAQHMQGLNERLTEAFPAIADALPHIREQRRAFRKRHSNLSFAQQDLIWRQEYPGTTSHSQLDVYRCFAPEVFDEGLTTEVEEWLQDPVNFGHAEYADTEPMLTGLGRIGALPVLFTLGQSQTPEGNPGWQHLKVQSAPNLSQLPGRIVDELPNRGKGQVIAESYDENTGMFRFTTDQGVDIISKQIVMVDDSTHNMELPPEAMGILVDRTGKYEQATQPSNVHVISSLVEVPVLVEAYMQGN